MNKYTKIKDDAAFHAARAKGVGASDVPTLAGLNRRYGQTPLTLWREKLGLAQPFEGNERTYWGNELEVSVLKKFIAGRYGDEAAFDFQGQAIRGRSSGPFKVKTEAVHPERSYCLAHADLVVDGAEVWVDREVSKDDPNWSPDLMEHVLVPEAYPYLVEAKTSGLYSAKRREGVIFDGYDPEDRSQFGVPDKVFMQVQWQMYVYGVTEAWVVVLIDTADYREYGPIVFDPRHVEQSLALAEAFWSLVESGTEPTPTTWGDVVSLYPDLENKTAMVSGQAEMEARAMVSEGNELKARVKALNERLDDIKMGLGILAGDQRTEDGKLIRTMNRVLNDSEGKVIATFSEQTRDTLSLSPWLTSAAKKKAKGESLSKKAASGKEITADEIESTLWTPTESEAVAVEARLRSLGAYKTSEPFRVVNY